MRRPSVWALALVCAVSAAAQASSFYDFVPGARAMGLGMAYTAIADDPSAMFFNPAGTANTPYIQSGFDLGRVDSPAGPMTFGDMTYLRPYDPINTATLGAAYYGEHQTFGGNKDEFLFHYSQEVKLPQLYLSQPLKVGGNFKFVNVSQSGTPGGGVLGLGFDGGILARSTFGLSSAFTMTDVTSKVGQPRPTLTIGNAYAFHHWLTFAGDLRVRSDLTEFYPGVEVSLDQGLLKLRAGKGFSLGGVKTIAFGFGVDLSPMTFDVAMMLPAAGINRQGGGFQASFNYKFGAPSFTGRFVGRAASQAEELKTQITKLQEAKKDLESQAAAASERKDIELNQVKVLQERVKDLDEQYRELEKKRGETEYQIEQDTVQERRLEAPAPAPMPLIHKPRRKKAPGWPRTHQVRPGDTLRGLAELYYGDPNLWEQIYDANRDKIDRGLPEEGATLTIPAPKPQ